MELELKKACFDAYEAAGELTLTQEETAETIVPDYCPDIARIIETTGKVFLHSREMRLYTSDYQRRMRAKDHPRASRTRNPCCGSLCSSTG